MAIERCRRRAGTAALATLAAGCASLVPIVEHLPRAAAGEHVVSVDFVTDRSLELRDGGRARFGERRGSLSAGRCRVRLDEPQRLDGDAAVTHVTRAAAEPLPLAAAVGPGRPLVVYVHGYNLLLDRACRHAATLQHHLGLDGRLLLFSWPANDDVFTYWRDVADLEWSVDDLGRVLDALVARHGAGRIVLLAHSLGARAVHQVLHERARRLPPPEPLLGVVLVAPDIDRAAFAADAAALQQATRRLTVYASNHDRLIALSRLWNGSPRLGEVDGTGAIAGVERIDVSPSGRHDLLGHMYHLRNPAVVEDLAPLLGGEAVTRGSGFRRERVGDTSTWRLVPAVRDGPAAADPSARPRFRK